MRDYSFALKTLGMQGVRTLVYRPTGKPLEVNDSGLVVPESSDTIDDFSSRMDTGGSGVLTTFFGTPVWANVILKTQDNLFEINLDTVLCDVSLPKHIIKTSITNRPGTFKEHIADGDYSIHMRGLLVEHSMYNYPRAQMTTLLQIIKRGEPIKVISEYLNLYGILNIVIESSSFTQKQGFQNVQPYDLTCLSDIDYSLIIKNGE
ncbi:hypothetical protein SDC9_130831 [bioreactor metagenome]|uniref:DUF6046 domain-containing protein n=1 Tax=bioreactor metagenome TaxID=1076179 RepID=A0A645D558_9ZZZZ